MDGFSIARSGRARCHFCMQLIAVGTLRAQYVWHVRKPSKWMHAFANCFRHLPVECRSRTREALLDALGNADLGAHIGPLQACLAAIVQGQSSGSGLARP